jgi:hypothetical protein
MTLKKYEELTEEEKKLVNDWFYKNQTNLIDNITKNTLSVNIDYIKKQMNVE